MDHPSNNTNQQSPAYDLTTNFGKWQFFLKDCPSPQIYIDFGFYTLIASALQRRVWIGDELNPVFPNIYTIMVGKAGIGKGQVIFPVLDLLRHHKWNPMNKAMSGGKPINISAEELKKAEELQQEAREMQEAIMVNASFTNINNPERTTRPKEPPLLFPMIEDATTYEALCQYMSLATRSVPVEKFSKLHNAMKKSNYIHTSLILGCEELGTLFREKARDTVNFLLATYNCKDYTYRTKTGGTDFIKKGCLNMLAGTTPSFMEQIFTDRLLNEGLSSRTFFVFASSNRFYRFKIAEYSEDQLKARKDLIDYVGKLSTLYGQCILDKEADDFLTHWWEVEQPNKREWRINNSPKLDAYYARKNLHAMKMAMILHFGGLESLEVGVKPNMTISLSCVQRALFILEQAEKSMHHALNVGGANPLAGVARKVQDYLKRHGPTLKDELLLEFYDDVKGNEFEDVLTFLEVSGKIQKDLGKNAKNTDVWIYKLKPREQIIDTDRQPI